MASSTGTVSPSPRNASRIGTTVWCSSAAGGAEIAGPSPGRDSGPHGLGEIVGEALERLDGLSEPEHEHERRMGGQLDVDVVGRRAVRRPARIRSSRSRGRRSRSAADPSRRSRAGRPCPRRRPHSRESASIASRARAEAAIVRSSSASPWAASWRRALSSEASSSELGLVERTSRMQRATSLGIDQSLGGDVEHRRLGQAADDLVGRSEHGVGAAAQRRLRQRG